MKSCTYNTALFPERFSYCLCLKSQKAFQNMFTTLPATGSFWCIEYWQSPSFDYIHTRTWTNPCCQYSYAGWTASSLACIAYWRTVTSRLFQSLTDCIKSLIEIKDNCFHTMLVPTAWTAKTTSWRPTRCCCRCTFDNTLGESRNLLS